MPHSEKEYHSDDWKKYLLKSGLPFEYEVKESFVKHGCLAWDEFTYLRGDENYVEKQFSYDLDANTWNGEYSIDFMVECKYKTEPTRWVFTPHPYSDQHEISRNAFLHPSDHFSKSSFLFHHSPYDEVLPPIGPICLKGVEILRNKAEESTITRAISQLSFAFVDKVIMSFNDQINLSTFENAIFLHVPVIITNADLYLLKTNVTTDQVSQASAIEDVSTKHDFLIFHSKIGEQLRNYNLDKLSSFIAGQGEGKVKERLSTFTNDPEHFRDVMATHYCPQAILIMHHSDTNYKALMDYVNFLTKSSDSLHKRMDEVREAFQRKSEEFERRSTERKKAREQSKS